MTRTELTRKAFEDMGWKSIDMTMDTEDIVYNIKAKDADGQYLWKNLKCTKGNKTRERDDWGMCSTYRVRYRNEILEVSADGEKFYPVAERFVEVGRQCIYAD